MTWPKWLFGVASVCATIGIGWWSLIQTTMNSFDKRLDDAIRNIQNGMADTASVRAFSESSNAALKAEFDASRKDFGDHLDKLGDRLVDANNQIGDRIDRLRTELVDAMDKRDSSFGGRFDRLEQKMDTMLTRITFEPAIEAPAGTYMIDEKGNFLGLKGDLLGTLPAVLRPAKP